MVPRSIHTVMFIDECHGYRDSGNDFRVPKTGSDNGYFSLFFFRFLMSFLVVSLNHRCFLELAFVSGAD